MVWSWPHRGGLSDAKGTESDDRKRVYGQISDCTLIRRERDSVRVHGIGQNGPYPLSQCQATWNIDDDFRVHHMATNRV